MSSEHPVSEDFRQLMSCFPSGVAVVTAYDSVGHPLGLTCSALSSVAISPPALLVCLRTQSKTTQAALSRGTFVVNFLTAEGEQLARVFASPVNRFENVSWHAGPTGPCLDTATHSRSRCEVIESMPCGDHTIIVGGVLEVSVEVKDPVPLIYGKRSFASWPTSATPLADQHIPRRSA